MEQTPNEDPDFSESGEQPVGEGFDTDMRRPFARVTNKLLRGLAKRGVNAHIDLGEHGEHNVKDVRFRDALQHGELKAYIRREAGEHKIITAAIALGVVATAVAALKHHKK